MKAALRSLHISSSSRTSPPAGSPHLCRRVFLYNKTYSADCLADVCKKEQQRCRKKRSEGPNKHGSKHQVAAFRFFAGFHGHRPLTALRRAPCVAPSPSRNESGDLGREKASGHESLHGPPLFTTNGNADSRGATNSDDDGDGDSTCSDDGDGDSSRSKPANKNCSRWRLCRLAPPEPR
jgi:hypothetical protein